MNRTTPNNYQIFLVTYLHGVITIDWISVVSVLHIQLLLDPTLMCILAYPSAASMNYFYPSAASIDYFYPMIASFPTWSRAMGYISVQDKVNLFTGSSSMKN